MEKNTSERLLILGSQLAADYQLTESGVKNLQHVFTTWFPRVVYFDLTDDTVRVNVIVRRGNISRKNVFSASFLRADNSLIKKIDYDEDRMVGKVCAHYDQSRTGYYGKKEGYDCRLVYYATDPSTITPQANRAHDAPPAGRSLRDTHVLPKVPR